MPNIQWLNYTAGALCDSRGCGRIAGTSHSLDRGAVGGLWWVWYTAATAGYFRRDTEGVARLSQGLYLILRGCRQGIDVGSHGTVMAAMHPEPGVLQGSRDRATPIHTALQQVEHEVLGLAGDSFPASPLKGKLVVQDTQHHDVRRQGVEVSAERELPRQHPVEDHPHSPQVGGLAVAAQIHFWGGVQRGACTLSEEVLI
mmetsp:Transcript_35578/g.100711  ORF Transcript_35578/g.100711 Transcript_35578/m.100711 type:complete len:200 (+) Transcript_35578:173-772(+)